MGLMSTRGLPSSNRSSATWAVLALAAAFALGLASVFTQELHRPATPLAAASRSRLVAALEGAMAANVTPGETERFKAWVASGATREGYGLVESVVTNNCASCHGPGGQYPALTRFEDLQPLAWEPASEGIQGLVGPKTLHLVVFPLLLALAVARYLRRTAWQGRRVLMGACALAGLADAAQWWLRQGQPEALAVAWATSLALGLVMTALVGVVLWELHGPRAD